MDNGILYHYTDLKGFLGIIEDRKLWLTSAFNLNDSQEVTWAYERIQERINIGTYDNELSDIIKKVLLSNKLVPYVCSLTSEGDLLSQWRAYSQDGSGVAIGFKRSALPEREIPETTPTYLDRLVLAKVEYELEKQHASIDMMLERIATGSGKGVDFFRHLYTLMLTAPVFKNPAFEEENEWRIIHTPNTTEGPGRSGIDITDSVSPLQLRISGSKLIPYFEYKLVGATPSDIFAEVVLGPKCETLDHDLKIFLTQNGLRYMPFRRSEASYR